MILLILLCMLVYLGIGTQISRVVYANQLHAVNSNPEHPEYRKAYSQLRTMQHDENCYMGPHYNKGIFNTHYTCDCSAEGRRTQFRDLRHLALSNMPAAIDQPDNPYYMTLFWPVKGYHAYLTGGKVDKPNYAAIQELELANGLAELES